MYFLCVDFVLILQPNSALFEACCNERIQQFNDSNSDEEDMWEEKELTYTSTAESRPRYILYTSKKENKVPVRQCILRYLYSHLKGTGHDFCRSGKPINHFQKQANIHIFQNK